MKRRGEIDRDHRIPALNRKILDSGDMLDTGIVDKNVHRAELRNGVLHHLLDLFRLGHVSTKVGGLDAELCCGLLLQICDLRGIAKPVEYDVRALRGERLCDAEADSGGGAGHEGGFSGELASLHGHSFCNEMMNNAILRAVPLKS